MSYFCFNTGAYTRNTAIPASTVPHTKPYPSLHSFLRTVSVCLVWSHPFALCSSPGLWYWFFKHMLVEPHPYVSVLKAIKMVFLSSLSIPALSA